MAFALLVTLAATALGPASTHTTGHQTSTVHIPRTDGATTRSTLAVPNDLSAWTSPHCAAPSASLSPQLLESTKLLIGVKSAALHGFQSRQTIRQTWGNPAHRPQDVAVLFLGCEPVWAALADSNTTRQALEDEKAAHGDLLTDEIQCQDSYETLVEKVRGFFRWVHDRPEHSLPALAFVMITDDDVYVDVPAVKTMLFDSANSDGVPRRRFYGGEVIQKQYDVVLRPLRDPRERNYVPVDAYPLKEKPHFATGAHYLLSIDLVRFLGRNSEHLQGVGTLEDVSVGFWLASLLNVHPVHIPQFDNVRFTLCHNALVAYADLSELAMHRIYHNRQHNRSLCDGYRAADWDKRDRRVKTQLPQSHLTGSSRVSRPLRHHYDLQFEMLSSVVHIVTTISVDDQILKEAVVVVYTPAKDSFNAYCSYVLTKLRVEMPTTLIPRSFCFDHRANVALFMSAAAISTPSLRHLTALARGNIQEDGNSLAVFVQLTPLASKARTLVECLMTAVFTGVSITVLDIADHMTRFRSFPPNIIFSTTVEASITAQSGDTPVVPRMIILRSTEDATVEDVSLCRQEAAKSTVEVSSFIESPPCPGRRLYIPTASQTFARRYKHSPLALLEAAPRTQDDPSDSVLVRNCHTPLTVASAAAEALRQAFLDENIAISELICDSNRSTPTLDEEVVHFSKYKFVVVIEDRLTVPGLVSHQLVSAFLAGAVPVYVGHSETARWIFNSRAFVDCGSMDVSLRACATLVRHVAGDPARYDAMRTAPPVVNETVFLELFSWHPLVAERGGQQELLLGERLRALILDA